MLIYGVIREKKRRFEVTRRARAIAQWGRRPLVNGGVAGGDGACLAWGFRLLAREYPRVYLYIYYDQW
jgi:hypothetical protein